MVYWDDFYFNCCLVVVCMSGPKEQAASVTLVGRKSLEAVVHRACPGCGAPAFYKAEESIREGWPGCWVPNNSPNKDQYVGDLCPNCGLARTPDLREDREIGRAHV